MINFEKQSTEIPRPFHSTKFNKKKRNSIRYFVTLQEFRWNSLGNLLLQQKNENKNL